MSSSEASALVDSDDPEPEQVVGASNKRAIFCAESQSASKTGSAAEAPLSSKSPRLRRGEITLQIRTSGGFESLILQRDSWASFLGPHMILPSRFDMFLFEPMPVLETTRWGA